jgi:N6-L-threonylcarbamoyladenine synthase
MLILGLETSCDETAAAIVRDGRLVESNVIASQHELHAPYAGVVPELASRAHAERILPIVRDAIAQGGVAWNDVGAIAVGNRPGLIGSLLVGVAAAKATAWALGKPLIAVDHVQAHLYAGMLRSRSHETTEPRSRESQEASTIAGPLFPALGLVVSGGHTSLYAMRSWTDLTRLGATIDDAIGEAYDKAGTILGLPYPGGPHIDRLASSPDADDRAHDFPIARITPDSLDFSFSGLKTSVLYAVWGIPLPGGVFERDHSWLSEASKSDLAASFQRAAIGAICLKIERAIERFPGAARPVSILVGGGVSANSRLRRDLADLARRRGVRLVLPAMEFCLDNAAMIAGLAHELLIAGQVSAVDLQASPASAL